MAFEGLRAWMFSNYAHRLHFGKNLALFNPKGECTSVYLGCGPQEPLLTAVLTFQHTKWPVLLLYLSWKEHKDLFKL